MDNKISDILNIQRTDPDNHYTQAEYIVILILNIHMHHISYLQIKTGYVKTQNSYSVK